MSDRSRSLPDQPNLRYLKIEAKRRLSAGEFPSLHDAQLAIAREHGLSSWAALKATVEAAEARFPALGHVRWVADRFAGADDPGWAAPEGDELRDHFDEHYLSLVPAQKLIGTLRSLAPRLRADLVVSHTTPLAVRAQIADLRVEAAARPDPPHRLATLSVYPLGQRVTDPRTAAPATRSSTGAPARAVRVAEESFAELGLVGLALAGRDRDDETPLWTVVRGWAQLDRNEPLHADHRFPAYGVSKLVTSTAVLRLVAEGRVDLDGPANAHLRTLRLDDGGVTVRELLTHTGGVVSPDERFADAIIDPVAPLGHTVSCDNRRGSLVPSDGGYAVLGQLIADVTGAPYPEAAAALVLEPTGMVGSWFPVRWPENDAIGGHLLSGDGSFVGAPRQVCTLPAAGGLWSTAPDLVRFGLAWSSLLPDELVREALRPQVAQPSGASVGLGWLINEAKDLYGHPGTGPGAAASLTIRLGTGAVTAVCTNRQVPIEPVNARLIRTAG
ncbi:hypothetical protein GCM10023322_35650 [Rugosimonospora acidiphila]|uniref:Beta-lactamase-related domain-containing protein n=1 Tax=Rugosimonospora acidiphila TaxID=556531 RepID=A0ABP9RWN3_9ACTN